MAIREIRLFGDPVLRSVCDPIPLGDRRAAQLIDDLLDTVKVPGRAGLAANQIGVGLRAFSYNVDDVVGYIINPVLVETGGESELVDEGCLSVPGFYFPRTRYPYARVEGVDLEGAVVSLDGTGLMAQALQHEVDHLDGKLFIDHLSRLKRERAVAKVKKNARMAA